MTTKERYSGIIEYFLKNAPNAETELHYNNPYELLVSVILSAQCTDKRVNMVTPAFFKVFPDAIALSNADIESVFTLIKSISYPNNKAKSLVGMAKMLVDKYNSIVPNTIEELELLPGVGRKTANVIASVVYDMPAMAVDTHVQRVSKRIGLVKPSDKSPLQIEKELVKNIPEKYIAKAHHWLILHGRYVCKARKPECGSCGIAGCCKYFKGIT
ncbi:MAG: endonuclease III [Bacteroidota bacterium]|nr:endonuclease III [Bacteroidota bacterium]